MIRSLLFVTLVTATAVHSDALAQPITSRRTFVGKLVTAGAVVATTASNPGMAFAKPTPTRGGKEMIDATHNGTELNGKESGVASGLLGKMGIDDITPDRGSKYSNKGAKPTVMQTANAKNETR